MSDQNLLDRDSCPQAWPQGPAAPTARPIGSSRQWDTCLDPEGDPRWAVMLFWGWMAFSVFSVVFMAVMFVLGVWYD